MKHDIRPVLWKNKESSWLRDFEPFFEDVKPLFNIHSLFEEPLPSGRNFQKLQEEGDFYRFTLDVPGINPKDISVKTQDHCLHIKAGKEEKELENGRKSSTSRHLNISFPVPRFVDTSKIEANCENGVLEVIFPKKLEDLSKKIEVQSTSNTNFIEKIRKQFKTKV